MRTRNAIVTLIGLIAGNAAVLPTAHAQTTQTPASITSVSQFYSDVAISTFNFSNGSAANAGYARYSTQSQSVTFTSSGLVLPEYQYKIDSERTLLIGLDLGYATATSTVTGTFAGSTSPNGVPLTSNAVTRETGTFRDVNVRLSLGYPIELDDNLILTPRAGIGYMNEISTRNRISIGSQSLQNDRLDFNADYLVSQVSLTLRYNLHYGELDVSPAFSVENIFAYTPNASITQTFAGGMPGARALGFTGWYDSMLYREGIEMTGPLHAKAFNHDLKWQTYLVANQAPGNVGLYHWAFEAGVAIGVNASDAKNLLFGFDPGDLFIGVAYVIGDHISGAKLNLGLRF